MPAKTTYHSKLRELGPVTMTIKTGPMKSKFSKPDAPKPDYFAFTMNGEEFTCSIDSQQVAAFVTQHKGQTLTVCAEGGKDDAQLVAVGAPASQMQQPAPRQQPAQQPPAATTNAAAAQQPQQPALKPAHAPVYGGTVGMCLKESCNIVNQLGIDPFSPDYYKQVYEISSDLIRVALQLEAGKLAPSAKERAQK